MPLDNVHAALLKGGALKLPAMPAAPHTAGAAATPTLQQAASMQDPSQRGAALRQQMLEQAAPYAQAASAAVPAAATSEAKSVLPKAVTLLPSAEEAGKVFLSLDQAIGSNPVDITKVGDVALEAQDWAFRGARCPK